jgi:predicted O-methyltransferase YrrM
MAAPSAVAAVPVSPKTVEHNTAGVLYACMPCYGNGNKAAHRQFWSASIDPRGPYAKMESQFGDQGSSLLADGFNVHWCNALNQQLMGNPITRFAMLHDDVVPESFWLDKLLTELDSTGADLVAAVVPIKDGRGLTSTAIDDPMDPWEVWRRLTSTEIEKLPETFGAADIATVFGAVHDNLMPELLLNTGCWVCDFTKPWRFQVHFEIKTRITFHVGEDWTDGERSMKRGTIIPNWQYRPGMCGEFCNQVMPEDWDFSRQLNDHGAKILGTRKVKLAHVGDFPYPGGKGAYGNWKTDQALRRKFDPSWKDIPEIEGWLSENEGRALADLACNKNVLEIGSWCGLSTVWMARKAKLVVALDTFDGRGTAYPRNTYEEFMSNIRRYEVEGKVMPLVSDSASILSSPSRFEEVEVYFDLVFIDGAHDLASIKTDFALAERVLDRDGLIAFHDYKSSKDPNVTAFVDQLLRDGYKATHRTESLIVISKTRIGEHNGQRTADQEAAAATA